MAIDSRRIRSANDEEFAVLGLLEDGGDSVFRELRADAIAGSAGEDKDFFPWFGL